MQKGDLPLRKNDLTTKEEDPLMVLCNHYAPFLNYIKLQWDDHPFPRPPLPALLENDLSTQAFSGKIVFLSAGESMFIIKCIEK